MVILMISAITTVIWFDKATMECNCSLYRTEHYFVGIYLSTIHQYEIAKL